MKFLKQWGQYIVNCAGFGVFQPFWYANKSLRFRGSGDFSFRAIELLLPHSSRIFGFQIYYKPYKSKFLTVILRRGVKATTMPTLPDPSPQQLMRWTQDTQRPHHQSVFSFAGTQRRDRERNLVEMP